MEESKGGLGKLERIGKGWVEETRKKGAEMMILLVYEWFMVIKGSGEAVPYMCVLLSEGFLQQVGSFSGDFQTKRWRDWVACAQNWGNYNTQTWIQMWWTTSDLWLIIPVMSYLCVYCMYADGHEQPEPRVEILQSFLEHALQRRPWSWAKGEFRAAVSESWWS